MAIKEKRITVDNSKRDFCKNYVWKQIGQVISGFKNGISEAEKKDNFDRYFESYESSYALTLAYSDDILIETAHRYGIETQGREKNDIIKELFKKQGGREYRF